MEVSRVSKSPLRLGKYANISSPPPDASRLALVERFALQAGARHLLPADHRTQGCLRWRVPGVEDIEVWYVAAASRARLGGLQTCASVWACPVCATKISERRKKELELAISSAHSRGYVVAMFTTTLRHQAGNDLHSLVAGMMAARSKGFSGAPWKRLRERSGWVGSIRAIEVTLGENGWHPHIHELVIFESDKALGRFTQGFRERWSVGLAAAGLPGVNLHGVDMTVADSDIAGYVAKFGHSRSWNVEHELTKQVTKRGRGSRSPMQLLADFTFGGDIAAGAAWREYALSMRGRHQLQWSKGLRRLLLGSEQSLSDEQIAQETEHTGTLMALISHPVWQKILADDAVAHLLNVASTGDRAALKTWLAPYLVNEHIDPFQLNGDPELISLRELFPLASEVELRGIMASSRMARIKKVEREKRLAARP